MIDGSFPRPDNAHFEAGTHLDVAADAWLDERNDLAVMLQTDPRTSNAELIGAAWRRWGVDCCDHLLGDFAFALRDDARAVVMLARDPVGTRSLYYYAASDRIFFDSDLERLLQVADLPHRLDEPLLAARLLRPMGFLPPLHDRTFWKGVHKLAPGHRLIITAQGLHCSRWRNWESSARVRFRRNEDYAEAMAERVEVAVGRCLAESGGAEPGKVASHISGGVDCSAIAVLAARQLNRQGRQLAAGYTWFASPDSLSPEGDDAWPLVESLAKELETPLHSAAISCASLACLAAADFTRRPVAMLEYEQDTLLHAASQGIRVILSGWGGDEAATVRHWAGWFDLLNDGRWRDARKEFRLGAAPASSFPIALFSWFGNRYIRTLLPGRLLRRQKLYGYVAMPFVRPAYSEKIIADPAFSQLLWPHPTRGLHARYMANLNSGYLAYRMESWANAAAAHGICYRYPLLDRELVEFCVGLPPEQTIQGGVQRSLFRRSMKGLIPESIRLQEKPRERQRVSRLGQVNDAATELLAERARAAEFPRLFDWIDYDILQRLLDKPAADPQGRLIRRQAARVALLSTSWQ